MAFGQTREEKLRNFKEMPKTKSEEPQTVIPTGNIGIVNLEQKKKPHNVTIQNYNKNEPKIKANIKYSAKQSFRRYKTKTEPNLLSKIQVNEDDDIVNKIKEALGIKTESKNSNYTETETSSVPFYKGVDDLPAENITDRREPIARKERIGIGELLKEITDVTRDDFSELSGLSSEYDFDTEFTPERRISRREKELNEIDFERFPEENPFMMAMATPTEKALRNRLSAQLTPKHFTPRTPEERQQARAKAAAENDLFDNELAEFSVKLLGTTSEDFVTQRKVGRPEASYGAVRRMKEANERTVEQNQEYFKTRKSLNKRFSLPQKSLKELMEKRVRNEIKLFNARNAENAENA